MKRKVLFIGIKNSARNQMAAAGNWIGMSCNQIQSVFDVFKSGQLFAYAITVCSERDSKECPVFPGLAVSRFIAVHQHTPTKAGENAQGGETNARVDRGVLRRTLRLGITNLSLHAFRTTW